MLARSLHGVHADADVVTEPTATEVWIACRGSLIPAITVPGRADHAGVGQPDWRDGGAVNAVQKGALILVALDRFRKDGSPGPTSIIRSCPPAIWSL